MEDWRWLQKLKIASTGTSNEKNLQTVSLTLFTFNMRTILKQSIDSCKTMMRLCALRKKTLWTTASHVRTWKTRYKFNGLYEINDRKCSRAKPPLTLVFLSHLKRQSAVAIMLINHDERNQDRDKIRGDF